MRREGRFLTEEGILRATDVVLYIYLFSYLSSANSNNCKLTSLNNPARRCGAGRGEQTRGQRERVSTYVCENSVCYSCVIYR